MKKLFFPLFLFSCFPVFAQMKTDTSFTLHSEYLKQVKKYPLIKKASVQNYSLIKMSGDRVYKRLPNGELHFDAFINKSKENLPAVILVHGGGWKSGSKEMQNPLARTIASAGYQTFTVEYRLSDEAKYPAAVDDVRDALNFIKENAKEFKIDAARIAILGCSSGGQIASLIGSKYPEEVNAVIDIDGILAFHHPDSEEGKLAALWLGGTYEEMPEVWKDASALTHVSDQTPPFLFINSPFKRFSAGKDDFIKKLNGFGIYSQVEKIENGPHTFWIFDPWFQSTTSYIINFLNFNFKK